MRPMPQVKSTFESVPFGNFNEGRLRVGRVDALLWSQNHTRSKNGNWNSGGEFLQASSLQQHSFKPFNQVRNGYRIWGTAGGAGHLLPAIPGVVQDAGGVSAFVNSIGSIDSHREAARADFSAGWQKTRPGNPVASLAQFIVELRDFPSLPGTIVSQGLLGLDPKTLKRQQAKYRGSFLRSWLNGPVERIPHRIQAQVKFFNSLGSEYLNWVFGWSPFISDLAKLYVLSESIDGRIKQIQRDNGRGVRRRASVSNESESNTVTVSYPYSGVGLLAPFPWYGDPQGCTWTTTRTESRRSWYSARYRYYVPDIGSSAWVSRAKRVLAGAEITPSLVWELTPWSWMIDWYLNVGDIISNFSQNAVDDLVADYAFTMVNTKVEVTSTPVGSFGPIIGGQPSDGIWNNVPGGSYSLPSKQVLEVKARVMGSPYGLGVKFDSLSGRQLGVLAALGISRSSF